MSFSAFLSQSPLVVPTSYMSPKRPQTIVVNSHGGFVYLNLQAGVDQGTVAKNPEAGEGHACSIASYNPTPDGKIGVGLEFVQPAPHFWGLSRSPSLGLDRSLASHLAP